MLSDNNNFDELLELCHERINAEKEALKEALVDHFIFHHKFMLQAIRKSLDSILDKVALLDKQIELLSKPNTMELEFLQTIPVSIRCLLPVCFWKSSST